MARNSRSIMSIKDWTVFTVLNRVLGHRIHDLCNEFHLSSSDVCRYIGGSDREIHPLHVEPYQKAIDTVAAAVVRYSNAAITEKDPRYHINEAMRHVLRRERRRLRSVSE